ncbi:hypothetical protein AMECASPLE_006627 [Ameca splendens]|uniref:Uncharacterized protein n=1 Tax=Ameca splendens TaxID=208324 RepID=A0ABV0XZG8_9TELE
MANAGFCLSMQSSYWGSRDWAGSDHMSPFRPFVWACLCGNRISCGHCAQGFNGPYIHCCLAWASQQKQIDTYKLPAPFGSHDTFQMDKKGHFTLLKILRKAWLP